MKSLGQIEPRTPISSAPFTINQSGSYYLTTNVLGVAGTNGITINADNVTVDLHGFALIANGGNRGVYVPNPARNIRVYNGIIKDWTIPVYAFAALNSRFEQLQLSENGGALNVGTNCLIIGCQFQNNSLGIFADNGTTVADCALVGTFNDAIFANDDVSVRHCVVRGGSARGIVTGNRCIIEDTTILSNANDGIFTGNGSSLLNCTVISCATTGIVAGVSCVIRDCMVQRTQGTAMFIGDASTVTGCSLYYNGGSAIYGNNLSLIKNCTIVSNSFVGVLLRDNNIVTGCLVSSNGSIGINVNNNSLVTDNNCVANGVGVLGGIYVSGSGNRIEDNTTTGNTSRGIEVTSIGNLIIRNSARTNDSQSINFDIVPGNLVGTIVTDSAGLNAATNNANMNISF